MPLIDELLGILFIIHTRGEHPPPHVHVKYNEHEASMDIKTGCLIEGSLPSRALKIAKKWIRENGPGALKQWEKMERGETPRHKKYWSESLK